MRAARYPKAYTEEERALFRQHSLAAEKASPHLFDGRRERPTIDPTLGRNFLTGLTGYGGQLCSAGQEFVWLGPDGDVGRCGRGPSMGNLLQGTARFKKKAKPCDRGHCYYFCEKFTARAAQQEWERAHPVAAMATRIKRGSHRRLGAQRACPRGSSLARIRELAAVTVPSRSWR